MKNFKFMESINVEAPGDGYATFKAGLAELEMWIDVSQGTVETQYYHNTEEGEEVYCQVFEHSYEGLTNALWEWLCTRSRFTNPAYERTLGSLRLALAETS